jgi:adenylate cyclase
VLAFDNQSAEPNDLYFADGIAEDIITELSRSRSLLVISRGSSFTYKGRHVDIREIGQELRVRYVLEGSVRRAGGRIRVNAQLIEAETGLHVWAERYDRALTDFFAVQDELTAAVAAAVEMAERKRALRKPPDSLDAWEACQRGLSLMDSRDFAGTLDAWGRAVALDPGFAPPHAMIAFTELSNGINGDPAYWELCRSAEARSLHAVGLDREEPIGHAMLSLARSFSGDHARGRDHAAQALELGRGSWYAWAAMTLATIGLRQFDAAEAAVTASLAIAPRGRIIRMTQMFAALLNFARGDYERSLQAAEAIRAVEPTYIHSYWIALAALGHMGNNELAPAALARFLDIAGRQARLFGEIGIPRIGAENAR